jgi:hypothetical protein
MLDEPIMRALPIADGKLEDQHVPLDVHPLAAFAVPTGKPSAEERAPALESAEVEHLMRRDVGRANVRAAKDLKS